MLFEFNGKAFNTETIKTVEPAKSYDGAPDIDVYFMGGVYPEHLPGTVQAFVAAQHEAAAEIQARAAAKIAAAAGCNWSGPSP